MRLGVAFSTSHSSRVGPVSPLMARAVPSRSTTKPHDSTGWLTRTERTEYGPAWKVSPGVKLRSRNTGSSTEGIRVKSGHSEPLNMFSRSVRMQVWLAQMVTGLFRQPTTRSERSGRSFTWSKWLWVRTM